MSPVTAKEDYGKAVLALILHQKAFYTLYFTNKARRFSFKSGCVLRVVQRFKSRLAHSIAVEIEHKTTLYHC